MKSHSKLDPHQRKIKILVREKTIEKIIKKMSEPHLKLIVLKKGILLFLFIKSKKIFFLKALKSGRSNHSLCLIGKKETRELYESKS